MPEKVLGSESEEMTSEEKHFKIMGLMTLGFLMKRRSLIFAMVILGIVTAFVLSYLILF